MNLSQFFIWSFLKCHQGTPPLELSPWKRKAAYNVQRQRRFPSRKAAYNVQRQRRFPSPGPSLLLLHLLLWSATLFYFHVHNSQPLRHLEKKKVSIPIHMHTSTNVWFGAAGWLAKQMLDAYCICVYPQPLGSSAPSSEPLGYNVQRIPPGWRSFSFYFCAPNWTL